MSRPLLCHLLTWALAGAAWAEDPAASLEGRTRVEMDLSLASRDSRQKGLNTELRYAGAFTPGYLRLTATHFFHPVVGASADVGADVFPISGEGFTDKVFDVERALQLSGSVMARVRLLESLSLEGQVGYSFSQFATLKLDDEARGGISSDNVSFSGPQLGAQVRFDAWGPLTVQAGARWIPLGIGIMTPAGLAIGSGVGASQAQVNVGVSYRLFAFGAAQVAIGAGYELAWTSVRDDPHDYALIQRSHRYGLVVRSWLAPEAAMKGLDRPSGPGRIHGLVVRDGNAPISGARVEVPGKEPVLTREDGRFSVDQVTPGPVAMTVTATGFKARAESLTLTPGGELRLTVTLQPPTGPGRIKGTAFAAPAQQGGERAPLSDVAIAGPKGTVRAGADGSFTLDEVGPGPVQVKATLKGYKPIEEVVSVPPEGEAALELNMVREAAKVLASVRGQVRTLRGKPVSAVLRIPEAQISTRTGSDGRFTVRLPGGRYTVVFEAPGYVRQTKTVEVADGDQAIFYVDLSREDR